MSFPPTSVQLKAIVEDLKEEVKKRRVCPLWRGGTIPSNFKFFFADVDPDGNFKKIFFKEGERGEFFVVK